MAIYVGVNGVPKKVRRVYVGVNGVPKEVKNVYAGNNDSPKQVYHPPVSAGETVFTSSGTFTVPKGVTKIDVFCVGGGHLGGGCSAGSDGTAGYAPCYTSGGYGGSGGFTTTVKSISVTPGDSIAVTVGAASTYYDYLGRRDISGSSKVGSFCTAKGGGDYIYI
jgi:hypothetical protein